MMAGPVKSSIKSNPRVTSILFWLYYAVFFSNDKVQGFTALTETATMNKQFGHFDSVQNGNYFLNSKALKSRNDKFIKLKSSKSKMRDLRATTSSLLMQTYPKKKSLISFSLFSDNSKKFNTLRHFIGFIAMFSPLLSKCPKAYATSHTGSLFSPKLSSRFSQIVSPIIFASQSVTLHLIQRMNAWIRCTTALTKAIWIISTLFLLKEFMSNLASKKRQQKDPTSEWGRYADYPAARGRALGILFAKLTPYILASSIAKMLSFPQTSKSLKQKSGNLLSDGLLKLGPLYIKIGQILSCREKLLPSEWVTALERLQDRVPAKSGADALELAYSAFGSKECMDNILESFENVPIAAASLGQVHLGTLRPNVTFSTNNDNVDSKPNPKNVRVAIKIQRARLRDIYDKDLALMKKLAKMGDKFAMNVGGAKQSWTDIFQDTEKILYREIDYQTEAKNAKQFAEDFGIGYNGTSITPTNPELPSASSWLRTPYIYEDLSNEKILVQEYVPSIKINDFTALEKVNVTQSDRDYLAECLARSYLRQFCSNQFFSTDPHPGNLGVEILPDNNRPRLVFYDFGQACSLQDDQAEGILSVMEGIMDLDAPGCVKAFDQMGVLVKGADLDIVTRKVQQNFDTGKVKVKKRKNTLIQEVDGSKDNALISDESSESTIALKSNETTNETPPEENSAVQDKDVMPYFTLPAEYAFVARALSQMDGVGKSLDPDFDFISAAAPHIVEVKGVQTYVSDKFLKWEAEWIEKLGLDSKKIEGLKNVINTRSFEESNT